MHYDYDREETITTLYCSLGILEVICKKYTGLMYGENNYGIYEVRDIQPIISYQVSLDPNSIKFQAIIEERYSSEYTIVNWLYCKRRSLKKFIYKLINRR